MSGSIAPTGADSSDDPDRRRRDVAVGPTLVHTTCSRDGCTTMMISIALWCRRPACTRRRLLNRIGVRKWNRDVRRLIAAFGIILVVGCGDAIPDVPAGEPVSYSAHLEPLVIAHCLGYHESEEPKAKLVLEEGAGYGQLVGRRSVQQPEMALVEPGDPQSSYLWLKLQHMSAEGKGMPRTLTGSKMLRPAELELYRRWIAEGALP
jgi:hypothetical protein